MRAEERLPERSPGEEGDCPLQAGDDDAIAETRSEETGGRPAEPQISASTDGTRNDERM